ncbi:MAG TPA: helix-turn-helix domain-containing protein [Candidatus Binatia bacterium]|nr:helix-turn-helix domain-containing protein [Candidatus Binatia bacterium]
MGDKEETLLNSRQAAEILDLSPDTVNELARKHTLPGIKRGRQWRFRRRDIIFLKKHLQEQVAA